MKTRKLYGGGVLLLASLLSSLIFFWSCSGATSSGEHVHLYLDAWNYDENTHWHDTTCNHGKIGEAPHTIDPDTRKCGVCGYIAPCEHTKTVTIPAKEATCTQKGITEGVVCSSCGKTITLQVEIPALGHNYVGGVCTRCNQVEHECNSNISVAAKAATCTEAGNTEGKKCSVCGKIMKGVEIIPATGHMEEPIPAKAATCTEKGLAEGKKCYVCGTILVAQKEVAALGHNYVGGACARCQQKEHECNSDTVVPSKAATCVDTGYTEGKKCSVCGNIMEGVKTLPATGVHKWGEGVVDYDAGTRTFTCGVCSQTKTESLDTLGGISATLPPEYEDEAIGVKYDSKTKTFTLPDGYDGYQWQINGNWLSLKDGEKTFCIDDYKSRMSSNGTYILWMQFWKNEGINYSVEYVITKSGSKYTVRLRK